MGSNSAQYKCSICALMSEVVPVVLTTPNGVFNYPIDTADMEYGDNLDSLVEVLMNMEEHSRFFEGQDQCHCVLTSPAPGFDDEFNVLVEGATYDEDLEEFEKPIRITFAIEFDLEVRMLSGATFHVCTATIFHKVQYIKKEI
eukprot:3687026-Amphidinium_carterae.1